MQLFEKKFGLFKKGRISITVFSIFVLLGVFVASDGYGAGKCADVVSININEDAKTTDSRDVLIYVIFNRKATHYIACEDPNFESCHWNAVPFYGPIKFRLSEGSGVKKIYFKAKNMNYMGAATSVTIELVDKAS